MKKITINSRIIITILRVTIGWHFLFEGITKLLSENWTAEGYLMHSTGFLSGFYHWMGSSPTLLGIIDFLNIYGLILIGLGLSLGLLIRFSAAAGTLLLVLYYFAYPPFGPGLFFSDESGIFIVNRLFIEAAALVFIFFYRERGYGIENLLGYRRKKAEKKQDTTEEGPVAGRREVLKNLASIPVLGLMGWGAISNYKKHSIDGLSGATVQVSSEALKDLTGKLPTGKIQNHEISRLVMGGNLIAGIAHSRDLHYVNSLFRAYNTERKVFETLSLAEQASINAISISSGALPLMNKYKKLFGSNIKIMTQTSCDLKKGDYFGRINQSIDEGADIVQIQGAVAEIMARDNKIDMIGKMLERIREQGYTAGLGTHSIETFIMCEEQGIIPDYYMKTMHHDNYWSAHPIENRVPFEVSGRFNADHSKFHDNMWCLFPEKTVEYVEKTKVPVIGFKTLAAGAIKPEDGFKWAFKHGADFICVGMFDFQIVKDVNICLETLNNLEGRKREWYG